MQRNGLHDDGPKQICLALQGDGAQPLRTASEILKHGVLGLAKAVALETATPAQIRGGIFAADGGWTAQ